MNVCGDNDVTERHDDVNRSVILFSYKVFPFSRVLKCMNVLRTPSKEKIFNHDIG